MLDNTRVDRRGFLGRLATAVAGLVAVPLLASPALARSRRRFGFGGYGGGYGGYGGYPGGYYRGSNRRYYGGYPGYGGGYGGYPGVYNRGYGGYGGYGGGYAVPYGGYQPGYGGGYGVPYGGYQPGVRIYVPMNAPMNTPKYRDALALLEA